MNLQEYLRPKIDLNLRVEYVNFVSTPIFDSFLPPFFKYKIEKVIPGKLVATQNINFYLNVEDANYKSLLVWISDETKEKLVKSFPIPDDLFKVYDE